MKDEKQSETSFTTFEWYLCSFGSIINKWTEDDFRSFWPDPHFNRMDSTGNVSNHFWGKFVVESKRHGCAFYFQLDEANRIRFFDRMQAWFGVFRKVKGKYTEVVYTRDVFERILRMLYTVDDDLLDEEDFCAMWEPAGPGSKLSCAGYKKVYDAFKADNCDLLRLFCWLGEKERRHFFKVIQKVYNMHPEKKR